MPMQTVGSASLGMCFHGPLLLPPHHHPPLPPPKKSLHVFSVQTVAVAADTAANGLPTVSNTVTKPLWAPVSCPYLLEICSAHVRCLTLLRQLTSS